MCTGQCFLLGWMFGVVIGAVEMLIFLSWLEDRKSKNKITKEMRAYEVEETGIYDQKK